MQTLAQLATALAAGRKSRRLVEECLARINDPAGEGRRVFLKVHAEAALAAADFYDRMRARGAVPSPFAGIPVSIKDLFDVAGDVTTAGSVILRDAPPAKRDAPSIARLRAAGFIPIGRSNMTEFAFSGLGINPHYDTPRNPYDRKASRIPGGSSSGAAVSVTDGMALAAWARIRAAPAEFRPRSAALSASSRPRTGFRRPVHFRCRSRSIPSARWRRRSPAAPRSMRCSRASRRSICRPSRSTGCGSRSRKRWCSTGWSRAVARAFEAALAALGKAGAKITDLALRELAELAQINAKGGLSAAESYAIHRGLIAKGENMYDPRVLVRILRGKEQDAADYIDLVQARADFIRRVAIVTAPYDALVMPTTPITAPRIDDLKPDDAYRHANAAVLRNPSIANFLDRCSISIPCHRAGEAPVGLMLFGEHDADRRLLAIAAAIEKVVSPVLLETAH